MQRATTLPSLFPRRLAAPPDVELPLIKRTARFATFAVIATVITGGVVLIGWMRGNELLMSGAPGLVAMNPATAVAFIAAGLSLWLLRPSGAGKSVARWGRLLAAAVAVGGLFQLMVCAQGWEFGFDRLLFPEQLHDNRMAPNTAVCFVLMGLSLTTLGLWQGNLFWLSQTCALAVAACSLLSLIGYAYGASALYEVPGYIPMAVNTAGLFQLLSLGVIVAHNHRGLAALLASPHLGGYKTWLVLPAAVAIPCALGWLQIWGQRRGLYGSELGAALMVALTVMVLIGIVAWTGRVLHRSDAIRKQAAEHIRDLYNLAPCGYHSLDANGLIIAINDTELEWLGLDRQEVEGKLCFADLVSPAHRSTFEEHYLKFMEGEPVRDLELELVRKEGGTLPVILNATAIRDAAGNYLASRSTLFDATERNRAVWASRQLNEELEQRVAERTMQLAAANQDLAQKNQENETFVYSVSHDLRSPLVNLQGFSRELATVSVELRELVDDESVPARIREQCLGLVDGDMEQSIHFIQSAVSRLSNIIDALLRLSRAGRINYQFQVVDVQATVAQIVDSLAGTIAAREAEVIVQELPSVHGDAAALEQVLANLVDNAVKYLASDRRGIIEIGCVNESGEATDGAEQDITYYIKDNGLGIPESCRDKIFLAFRRAHPAAAPGEGMGLAIARRVVERHGGKMWVDSKLGEGTTFFVSLPVRKPAPVSESGSHERSISNGDRSIGHLVG